MTGVGLISALFAGLVSFLSPCVLPLVPGYISFISGSAARATRKPQLMARAVAFTAGFTLVFVMLGFAIAGATFAFAGINRIITIASGVLVVLFGLNLIFNFAGFLNYEAKLHISHKPRGIFGAFVLGIAFSAGWTPCIGPILASILLYAGSGLKPAWAVVLLFAYSLGLSLPFLVSTFFLARLGPALAWLKARGRTIQIASGIFLIVLGGVMALGKLGFVTSRLGFFGIQLDMVRITHPAASQWIAVAVWLFISALLFVPTIVTRPFKFRPTQFFGLAFFALAFVEATSIVSTVGLVSRWLQFQGG